MKQKYQPIGSDEMLNIETPNRYERCLGAMLGTAIGDALGWPNEMKRRSLPLDLTRNDFVQWSKRIRFPKHHYETILKGEYSDDTQLTLSTARSILSGNFTQFMTERELPFWLEYQRGGGRALLKAARTLKYNNALPWKCNDTRDYFNAGGNGTVMRILPHIIVKTSSTTISELITNVVHNSIITHGHPRALLGANLYAYSLDYLMNIDGKFTPIEFIDYIVNGVTEWSRIDETIFNEWLNVALTRCPYDYVTEYNRVLNSMVNNLNIIKTEILEGFYNESNVVLEKLGFYSKEKGAGDVAILSALYLASKYNNNPIEGITLPALSYGADTDTIASITGGLLGMINGTKWIPNKWKQVQDYSCIVNITELLINMSNDNTNNFQSDSIDEWLSSPIGKVRLIDSTVTNDGVTISKWITFLGQTFYTKKWS